jgi:uncharacterized membrane protein YedE/YeeE
VQVLLLSALALLCVFTMGFAIQRGGTCTVAAVDELLSSRRAKRLGALLEASLWVAGGLALASLLGIAGSMPGGFAIDRFTVIGAVLLGLGAWVNRACVFGAIARLGSGEWAYVLSPLGFFVGCWGVGRVFARPAVVAAPAALPLLQFSSVVAPLFVVFAAWRLLRISGSGHTWPERVWSPHRATLVIGVTFVITLLAAGRWAYTDVLADLAQGHAGMLGLPTLLLLALLAGAICGGWTAGRFRSVPISAAQLLRCFVGGLLMGWGSLLIPGSNDGLILIGIPLLQPHAWLAFATMVFSIAAALLLSAGRRPAT